MAKHAKLQFQMPDEEGWREIKRSSHLSDKQLATLRGVLEEVDNACRALLRWPSDAQIRKGLKAADRLLGNLEAGLRRSDVITALRATETFGALGFLLSATAANMALEDGLDDEVPFEALEGLVARKRRLNEPVRSSELDELSILGRQRRLSNLTPEVMLFVTRCLRQPITSSLMIAQQDKGGLPAQIDRELLIGLLARNAERITGRRATGSSTGRFMDLCTVVLGQCGMETIGLADAVRRCLDKHAALLTWQYLPPYTSPVGDLTEEQLTVIPEDPEQGP